MLGTPAYMAPEQADSRLAAIGPHTDVYALGVVFYEVLTGRPPFQGSSDVDIVQQALTAEPVAPRRLRPDVTRDLETICLKCLEKEPNRRYASAALLTEDLRAFQAGRPIRARPARMWERAAKWARRRPALAALASVTAAALLALAVWAVWYDIKQRDHTRDLQNALDRAESGERRLREENYGIQIKLADSMQGNDPSGLLGDLLNSFRPRPDQEDLRGFEWYYLWNIARRELHLRGHRESVGAVAISSDGRMCASGDGAGELRLWDLSTGAPLVAWAGHTKPVNQMAFSRDGSRLAATAVKDGTGELILWDVATKRQMARLEFHSKRQFGYVAVEPSGSLIAFTADEEDHTHVMLGIWNCQNGQVKYLFRGRQIRDTALRFSPDGRTLAVGLYDPPTVCLWDLATGREHQLPPVHRSRIDSLAFLAEGTFLALGYYDGTIEFWDLAKSQLHATREVNEAVRPMTGSRDGMILAVAESPTKKWSPESVALTLWNWPKGDVRSKVLRPGYYIHAIDFSPDGQTVAVGCFDHHVHLWRPFAESAVSTLAVRGRAEAWSVAFSPDSRTLAVAYDDQTGPNRETLKLWDVRTDKELGNLNSHHSMVSEVAFAPDGHMLASASYDKTVKLWDPQTRQLLTTLKGAADRLRCLAVSPDGRLLAAAGCENNVHVWDIPTGLECSTLAGDNWMNRVAFAPDSKTLAAADFKGVVIIWDLATGQRVGTLKDARNARALAYAPNGLSVATGNADGIVKLWDVAGDSEPRSLIGHTAEVYTVAFSPDGKTLATGGEDRTVRLWQVSTGRELLIFKDLPHKVNSVAFSPDGRHLAAALHDGSVRLWHAAARDE